MYNNDSNDISINDSNRHRIRIRNYRDKRLYQSRPNSRIPNLRRFHKKTRTHWNYNEINQSTENNNNTNNINTGSDSASHLKPSVILKDKNRFSLSFTDSSLVSPSSSSKIKDKDASTPNDITSRSQTKSVNSLNDKADSLNTEQQNLSEGNLKNKSEIETEMIASIIQSEQEICDNDYETNEYFLKLKLEEFNTAFYTLISIICGIIYHDLTNYHTQLSTKNMELYNKSKSVTLILTSVNVILFNLSSLNRYSILLHIDKSTSQVLKKQSFFTMEYFGYFMIELFFSLFHPNTFLKNIKFKTNKTFYRDTVTYELNDMLLIIMFLRVYVLFRFFISISSFYTSRSDRIARLIGSHLNRLFVIRCIVLMYPFTFLLVSAVILVISTGYMLRIAESPAYQETMGDNDYRKFVNCLWNILVTMTTVGYGDYYPITNLGRLINIFVSLWGNCLTSFMVVALQNGLVFDENQDKAFNFREKQLLLESFQRKVALFFKSSFRYIFTKKKYRKSCELGYDFKRQEKLKKDMEESLYKKISAKRQFKTLFQLYRNTYEVLTEEEIIKEKLDKFQELLAKIHDNTEKMEMYIKNMTKVLDEIEESASNDKEELIKSNENKEIINQNHTIEME